jgi:toxin ParE1/3/4
VKRLTFTDEAEADLEAIGDHIALDSPLRAVTFIGELRQSCATLIEMPERHSLLHRHRATGIRRRVHGTCLIFYRVNADAVEILHILYGTMNYEAILFPEN